MAFLCHIERPQAAPGDYFFAGLTSGVCLCFATTVAHLLSSEGLAWSPHFMFYTYRPAGCLALAVWLWAANVHVFERCGVNHVFVLQTSADATRYRHASEIAWAAGTWTMLLLSAFWLQASRYSPPGCSGTLCELPPVVVWLLVAVAFWLPGERLLGSSRRMLQRTLGRVLCAPLFPIVFRDVLVGDILTSLVRPMVDLGHLSCYFVSKIGGRALASAPEVNATALALLETDGCGCPVGQGWSLETGGCHASLAEHWGHTQEAAACGALLGEAQGTVAAREEHCTQYNPWLDTVIALLPYVIRLAQCLRRHVDSVRAAGDKGFFHSPTQLYNAAKYGSCIAVTALSWADHMAVAHHADDHQVPAGYASWKDVPITAFGVRPFRTAWLGMVVFATLFKLYWDLVHDWSFSLHFWELRPRLLFPRPFYFVAIPALAIPGPEPLLFRV